MKEILTHICEKLAQDIPVALAMVVAQQGSTPRGTGSKMLADAHGLVIGTIGGGQPEGETLQVCQKALQDGTSFLVDFTMTGVIAAKSDMICGGLLKVLVQPIFPSATNKQFFKECLYALEHILTQGAALLVFDVTSTLTTSAAEAISGLTSGLTFGTSECAGSVYANAVWQGEILPQAVKAHFETQYASLPWCGLVEKDKRTYYIEKCVSPWRMLIAGGGHVSRPTAQVAALTGFEVTVLDDRAEFSQAERFPQAKHVHTVPHYVDCFEHMHPDMHTCIVIVTRGHVHDAAVLTQALQTEAGYIGMIGSSRKRQEVYDLMRSQGVSEEQLARVYSPIGLTIKAETPEEIAVSIVAQCIAHRRGACLTNA